jgi:hypothetical protein
MVALGGIVKNWMTWSAQLMAALLLAACSVQLVSPYNEQLATGLTKLNDDVLLFSADVARTAMNPATRSKAAYENYTKTYDGFRARVETMRIISDASNPGVVNCAKLVSALSESVKKDLIEAGGASTAESNVDCQTFLFARLAQMIDLMEEAHRVACAPANVNFRRDCVGGFGAASGVIRFGENSNGLIVQPTLTTIRTLIWVQEVKKPKKT